MHRKRRCLLSRQQLKTASLICVKWRSIATPMTNIDSSTLLALNQRIYPDKPTTTMAMWFLSPTRVTPQSSNPAPFNTFYSYFDLTLLVFTAHEKITDQNATAASLSNSKRVKSPPFPPPKTPSKMPLFPSSSGHDQKSLLINLFTTLLFLSPIPWYLQTASFQTLVIMNIFIFGVAILYPPVGWLRPHPYSDFERNKVRES